MPEMQNFNCSPILVQSVVDVKGRMEEPPKLRMSLYRSADVREGLKQFEVVEKIIEAGVQEIQALQAYIQTGAQDTQKVLEESQRRIAQYEEEVRRIKIVMDQRVQEQQAVMKACNDRKLGIQRVLEFFGQEVVARVVRDSPKLIDPSERKA